MPSPIIIHIFNKFASGVYAESDNLKSNSSIVRNICKIFKEGLLNQHGEKYCIFHHSSNDFQYINFLSRYLWLDMVKEPFFHKPFWSLFCILVWQLHNPKGIMSMVHTGWMYILYMSNSLCIVNKMNISLHPLYPMFCKLTWLFSCCIVTACYMFIYKKKYLTKLCVPWNLL